MCTFPCLDYIFWSIKRSVIPDAPSSTYRHFESKQEHVFVFPSGDHEDFRLFGFLVHIYLLLLLLLSLLLYIVSNCEQFQVILIGIK